MREVASASTSEVGRCEEKTSVIEVRERDGERLLRGAAGGSLPETVYSSERRRSRRNSEAASSPLPLCGAWTMICASVTLGGELGPGKSLDQYLDFVGEPAAPTPSDDREVSLRSGWPAAGGVPTGVASSSNMSTPWWRVKGGADTGGCISSISSNEPSRSLSSRRVGWWWRDGEVV